MAEFPISTISFNTNRADGNYYIPPHTHNFWQFYHVFGGDVEMTISQKKFRLEKGDSILIPPGLERSPRCISKPPRYMFVFFNNVSIDLEGISQIVLHAGVEQQVRLQSIADELEFPKDQNSNDYMSCTLICLLVEFCRSVQHNQQFQSSDHYLEIVSRLETYMRNNLHQPLSRKDMANIAHVSQSHIARIYKKVLSMTPLERLTQLRMQHAQFLLSQSDQPITTISADVGYESISHFSRTFRKYAEKSPRQYRRDFSKLKMR